VRRLGLVRDDPSVLLIRPDHLGDLLFCGPAIRTFRAAWPAATLTALVGPWSADVARRLSGIDHVAAMDFPWFDRGSRGSLLPPFRRLDATATAVRRLPTAPFDLAIILRDDDYWGAWLAARARVPLRIGHDEAGVRRFASHVLPARHRPGHVAAASLALISAVVGLPEVDPTPLEHPLRVDIGDADRAAASCLLRAAFAAGGGGPPTSGQAPIAIHPGSGAPVKRWRTEAWQRTLADLTGPRDPVVLTGSADEAALAAELAAMVPNPVADVTGRTDVGSLAAIFERCRLVMGPDSGPLHLAVAVGTPTVHLYGPADAARFGPWAAPARHGVVAATAACAPCGRMDWPDPEDHPCVRSIPTGRVVASARSILTASG
jgi:heptosyltransferase-2/heptosyltransferase-3